MIANKNDRKEFHDKGSHSPRTADAAPGAARRTAGGDLHGIVLCRALFCDRFWREAGISEALGERGNHSAVLCGSPACSAAVRFLSVWSGSGTGHLHSDDCEPDAVSGSAGSRREHCAVRRSGDGVQHVCRGVYDVGDGPGRRGAEPRGDHGVLLSQLRIGGAGIFGADGTVDGGNLDSSSVDEAAAAVGDGAGDRAGDLRRIELAESAAAEGGIFDSADAVSGDGLADWGGFPAAADGSGGAGAEGSFEKRRRGPSRG